MVTQDEIYLAMCAANRPLSCPEIYDLIGPVPTRDRSSVIGEISSRCNSLSKWGRIVRYGTNKWVIA